MDGAKYLANSILGRLRCGLSLATSPSGILAKKPKKKDTGLKDQGKIPYQKHNSFVDLRVRENVLTREALARCRTLAAKASSATNPKHNAVLAKALTEILHPETQEGLFRITPNVAAEIAFLNNEELPRYLFHRYRYERYPALKILDDYPPYLQIEPSSVCNYRCVFCFESDPTFTKTANGFMGKMSFELFREIVDQAAGNIEFISLASRGEPLACGEIEKMLAYTPGKFLNLKMNTNASLLTEEKSHAILSSGIRTLVFSADAAEEPLYSQLRVNGKFEKVLANIRRFKEIREKHYSNHKIITRVSGVKVRQEQDINSMEKLWGELVDQVAFVNYNPWENVYQVAPNQITTPCSDLWRRMFIWWDGKINPCDVDYKSTLQVGLFPAHEISQGWLSENYQILRKNHQAGKRQNIRPCHSCFLV
ncbi:MAG: radical SAM/SPASM domain-containing protein [Chlamydiae bacterium]|nr:radical SAM/SPASM domain-containing protein [Chlamydiota bacterium]